MAGGATAILLGLMFIAISLGANQVNNHDADRIETFVNPTLLNFSSVLLITLLMLIPNHEVASLAIPLLLIGSVGFQRSWQVRRQMNMIAEQDVVDPGHWKWHAYLPMVSYAVLCITTIWLGLMQDNLALYGVAFSTITLMFIGIRNTWELTLWIARHSPNE